MSSSREVQLNLISYIGARVTAIVVFAAMVPLALLELGEERYAVLAIMLLVIGFVPLIDAGAGYALTFRYMRRLARGRRTATALLAEHHTIYIVVSMAVGVMFFLAFPWVFVQADTHVKTSLATIGVAGGVASFFALLSSYGRAILVASRKTYIVNLVDLISDLARAAAIGVGAAIYGDLGVTAALLAVAFAFRWMLFAGIVARFSEAVAPALRINKRSLRVSMFIGAPLAFSAVVTVLLGTIDKFVMARVFPLSQVASYVLSYDTTTKGWMIVWAVNGAIMPILMRWGHARESHKLSRASRYTWALTFAVGVVVYLPLNLFEPEIIGWWVGSDMAASAQTYIFVFSIASLFYFATANLYNFLQASGRTGVIAKAYLVGLGCYVPVIALAAANHNSLLMASAHIVLWTAVAAAMWYWGFIRSNKGLDRAV